MAESLGRLFAPLTNLMSGMIELLHASGMPWWLSVVALTLVVRTILLPLTVKQVKNARSMQSLRPRIEEIRNRHKDSQDSREQQKALAELYRERGVNPLAGFLPLLIQMPVFITMYHVIRDHDQSTPSFAHGGMLWFADLTAPDPYFILPAISAGLMLAAFEVSSRGAPARQRRMMRFLPLVFTAFIARFPAGLFVYWITSNTVTLAQNLAINRHMPRVPVAEPAAETNIATTEPRPLRPVKTQAEKSAKRKRRKKKRRG